MNEIEALREELEKTRKRLHAVKREYELYLKETHHRMKNSLSVVSAILKMNAEHVEDERTRRHLLDSHQRIMSISLLHEKLFNARNVGFGDCVRSIADCLFNTYGADSGRIKMTIDMPGVCLTEKSRVPLVLIINELLSNALKHAFSHAENGEIVVKLTRGDNAFILSVSDTGCGLSEGLNIADISSFGMILVGTLVRQLGGDMEVLTQEGGAGFKISLPPESLIEL